MYTHVRILAILHLVFGGLGTLDSLFRSSASALVPAHSHRCKS